jgi:FkbM family methyltransferase
MTTAEFVLRLWYRAPKPLRAAYHRLGFGIRPLLRHLVTDEKRPVRIEGGLLRGMYMKIHPRSEHGYIRGDAELDVQMSLPSLVAPGMCAYNVGANYGLFTLALARLVGHSGVVIAFEPNPRVVVRLRENVALNQLANVTVEPVAVSDTIGVVPFALEGDFKSSLANGPIAMRAEEVILVQSTTIDAHVSAGGRVPDVLMMDVEDCEAMVLRGARATLRARQLVVIMEIHSPTAAQDVMDELALVDYVLAELPVFRRVGAPSEIRPRGHYVAAPARAFPSRTRPAEDTPKAALAYLAEITADLAR